MLSSLIQPALKAQSVIVLVLALGATTWSVIPNDTCYMVRIDFSHEPIATGLCHYPCIHHKQSHAVNDATTVTHVYGHGQYRYFKINNYALSDASCDFKRIPLHPGFNNTHLYLQLFIQWIAIAIHVFMFIGHYHSFHGCYISVIILLLQIPFQPVKAANMIQKLSVNYTHNDRFGKSVSLYGPHALIGAYYGDWNGPRSGCAHIFEDVNGSWLHTAKLLPNDGATYDYFGISSSLYNGVAVIGAPYRNNSTGAAYIFEKIDTDWIQTAKLMANDASRDSRFAMAVCIHNQRILIGSATGCAYVFENKNGNWTQTAKLDAKDGVPFGDSVSLYNDYALIGAIGNRSAYIFEYTNGNWSQSAKLLPDDGGATFGWSVAIYHEQAAIGANGNGIGAVYIFKKAPNGNWVQTSRLVPNDVTNVWEFGSGVSIDDRYVLIGAPRDATLGSRVGSAFIFEKRNGNWTQIAKMFPSEPYDTYIYFGFTVSLQGSNALIGGQAPDMHVIKSDPLCGNIPNVWTKCDTSQTNVPTVPPTTVPTSFTSAPSTSPNAAPSSIPTQTPTIAPTLSPSGTPTISPTMTPTVAPSVHPTMHPTLSPSIAPSRVPTQSPSVAPTLSPTIAPTRSPTLAPTQAPSSAPTQPPTTAPTQSPTVAPSLAPTQSPSACVDYYNYSSLDGIDRIHETHSQHPISYQNQTFASNVNVQNYISTAEHYFFFQDVQCNDSNADVCFIGCYNAGHCALANIKSSSNTAFGEIRVICSAKKSCTSLALNISDAKVNTISILCHGAYACQEAQIVIEAISDINISIDCDALLSCMDIMVRLHHHKKSKDRIKAEITCYNDHACDNMMINTDDSPNIFITLNAMRYSEDIQIIYHFWKNIEVNCGYDEDRRYIRYDTHHLLDEFEVLELARSEYKTRKLPCEDISIFCSNNTDFDRECEYKYKLNDKFSVIDILKDEDRPLCYWLQIGQLYQARCDGTCDDRIIYTAYKAAFDLDIIFQSTEKEDTNAMEYNVTQSYSVCDEYFGSVNATDDSLSSIDAVFYSVLSLMRSVSESIIHDILMPPQTFLRDGMQHIICENIHKNIIKITSNVTIESMEENAKAIHDLFEIDSPFINESTRLLSELFGIPIAFKPVTTTSDITLIENEEVIVAIVLGAVCVIGVILFCVIQSNRKRKANKEALTTYVQNPMVLFLGIAVYEDAPANPAVDGYFRDLGGIDVDHKNVNTLFGDKLNYNVFPKQMKLQWTLDQMMEFLTDRAEALESNIDSVYDGLVVILSCHGITDYIVTSDYKTIKKSAVHRIFTADKPKNRLIPRLFVFDCCDGEDEREIGTFRTETMNDESGKTLQRKEKNTNMLSVASVASVERDPEHKLKRTYSKNVELTSITSGTDGSWLHNEENPDFQLIQLHAANEGFQSKLNTKKGSFFITAFTQKMSENIENLNKKWLFEICDDIQSELQTKQHTVDTFNDNMRYLKFMRNKTNQNNTNDDTHLSNKLRKIKTYSYDEDTDATNTAVVGESK